MPLTPGSTFERYEIQSLIGRGGMGEVYRAIDTRLHRPVALKVLRTDKDASATVTEAGGVARLLREARAAAALNHANSVAIYELGEAEGIAYIAMELVIGAGAARGLAGRRERRSVRVQPVGVRARHGDLRRRPARRDRRARRRRCKGASPELGRVIARMMARRPRDRFPTMEAAAHALRACIGSQPRHGSFARPDGADDPVPSTKRASNAPTAVVDMAEPVSAEREIQGRAQLEGAQSLAKGGTIPLAMSLKAAVGDQVAAQLAGGGGGAAGMNRTLPLARPTTQQPMNIAVGSDRGSDRDVGTSGRPPSNPGLPGAPSGVYASRSQAEVAAQARSDALRTTGGTRHGDGDVRGASSSRPRLWAVLAVIVVAAALGSGVAAWLLR